MPYCRNCGCQLEEVDNFCETCGTARRKASPKRTCIGKTCPFCQFPLKADLDIIICPACGIPHHRECWEENSGCTTFGCRGLTEETEIQPAAIQPATITEVAPVAGEILEVSFESTISEVAGLEKLLSNSAAGDSGQWRSGQKTYQLTYKTGELSLQDLPTGTRVVDTSWKWDYRTGKNYSCSRKVKPVTWIVVAKNHYDDLEPHITLLAEELIGRLVFDNSTNRGSDYGSNHWGDSGTPNAVSGLRPWLNSTGIHAGEGFYQAFSESFKGALLATTLPNREWKKGTTYTTQDYVFIPSTKELGDIENNYTNQVGKVYSHFLEVSKAERIAQTEEANDWYWTRSPDSRYGYGVRFVSCGGEFLYYGASYGSGGVRPALNLKSEILVTEIRN